MQHQRKEMIVGGLKQHEGWGSLRGMVVRGLLIIKERYMRTSGPCKPVNGSGLKLAHGRESFSIW